MKKNFKLFLVLILSFAFLPVIFAEPTVKINGGVDNIYDGGSGSATFDKTTNTLTLNGYNGESIIFEEFDGETVNILLKGNNTISHDGGIVADSVALGFDIYSNEVVTMNINGETGSKLTVSGYYDGIHLGDGDLFVEDADIKIDKIEYVGIHAHKGNLFIKDSVVESNKCEYPLSSDAESVTVDNLKYSSNETFSFDFYATKQININNSQINNENDAILTWSEEVNIKNTDIIYKGLSLFNAEKVLIKDSKVDADITDLGTLIYERFEIDNSDVLIKSSIVALLVAGDLDDSKGAVVLKNVKLLTEDVSLGLAKTNIGYVGNCVSYFTEEPSGIYEEATLDNLISIAAKELHFVPDNGIENPQTADSIWVYVIITIISLTGIIMSLFLKKRYN